MPKRVSSVPILMTTVSPDLNPPQGRGTPIRALSPVGSIASTTGLPAFVAESVEWDYTRTDIRKPEVAAHVAAHMEAATMNNWSLRFDDPKVEGYYASHTYKRSQNRIRYILVIASVFYALWSSTDFILFPDDVRFIVPLRFAVVASTVLVFALTFIKNEAIQRNLHYPLVILVLVALTITAVIDYVQNNSFADMETTGFVMLLAGTTVLLRVFFIYAAFGTNFFVLVWGALALILGAIQEEPITRLAVRVLIVLGANIIFTMASYESEYRDRRDFQQSVVLMCRHYTALQQLEDLDAILNENGNNGSLNLTAPVESIVRVVRTVGRGDNLMPAQKEQLLHVERVLRGSRNIYKPDLRPALEHGDIGLDTTMTRWFGQFTPEIPGGRTPRRSTVRLQHADGMSLTTETSVLKVLGSSSDLLFNSDDNREVDREFAPKLTRWDFPVFDLEKAMERNSLPWVFMRCANHFDLCNELHIDQPKLMSFLTAVDMGYTKSNVYHNASHGIDVVQSCFYFLTSGGMYDRFRPADVFNLLVAAAVHDYDHPGHSTDFDVNTGGRLALLYNDHSPLENHHVAQAFILLAQEDLDIFCNYSKADRQDARQAIIDLVLATDLKKHFELLSTFRSRFEDRSFSTEDRGDRMSVMRMMVKCADVSNLAKQHSTMMEWVGRFFAESYVQGDKERAAGHQVISPFCDRYHKEEAKCEVGFLTYIIEPLFADFGTVYKKIVPTHEGQFDNDITANLKANRAFWDKERAKEMEEPEMPE